MHGINAKMGKFEPKEPVNLAPPNYSPISVEKLAESNGMNIKRPPGVPELPYPSSCFPTIWRPMSPHHHPFDAAVSTPVITGHSFTHASSIGTDGKPCYVGIKGIIFDVSGKEMYQPGGSYSGKNNSPRATATS